MWQAQESMTHSMWERWKGLPWDHVFHHLNLSELKSSLGEEQEEGQSKIWAPQERQQMSPSFEASSKIRKKDPDYLQRAEVAIPFLWLVWCFPVFWQRC